MTGAVTGAVTGDDLARAALALVGAPFRLHGRDPMTGLDCVGVVEAACRACGCHAVLPRDYTLRSRRTAAPAAHAARLGLAPATEPIEPGDVVMVRIGACQHHLAIAAAPGRFVHAHAGLRRIVAGPLPWPLTGHWRLQSSGN